MPSDKPTSHTPNKHEPPQAAARSEQKLSDAQRGLHDAFGRRLAEAQGASRSHHNDSSRQ